MAVALALVTAVVLDLVMALVLVFVTAVVLALVTALVLALAKAVLVFATAVILCSCVRASAARLPGTFRESSVVFRVNHKRIWDGSGKCRPHALRQLL